MFHWKHMLAEMLRQFFHSCESIDRFKDKSGSHKSLQKICHICADLFKFSAMALSLSFGKQRFRFVWSTKANIMMEYADADAEAIFSAHFSRIRVWQSCQWELFDIYWKTFWSHFFLHQIECSCQRFLLYDFFFAFILEPRRSRSPFTNNIKLISRE